MRFEGTIEVRDLLDRLPLERLINIDFDVNKRGTKNILLFPLQGVEVCFDLVVLCVFILNVIVDSIDVLFEITFSLERNRRASKKIRLNTFWNLSIISANGLSVLYFILFHRNDFRYCSKGSTLYQSFTSADI